MKRDEKNQLTRRKILESASVEFAFHGFEAGSVNTICQNGGVSKGIIYHYFSSKEELYLECVAECFDRLTDYLQDTLSAMPEKESDRVLSAYFDLRMDYFRENEVDARIFSDAVLTPPDRLRSEIAKCRQRFDELNTDTMRKILRDKPLRGDLKESEIIHAFQQFQDFLNAGYRNVRQEADGLKRHEQECRNALEILLYGIIAR